MQQVVVAEGELSCSCSDEKESLFWQHWSILCSLFASSADGLQFSSNAISRGIHSKCTQFSLLCLLHRQKRHSHVISSPLNTNADSLAIIIGYFCRQNRITFQCFPHMIICAVR